LISIKGQDPVWKECLNRPEKANAVTGEMLDTLIAFFENKLRRAKCVILTGKGQTFSAGADLKQASHQR